MLVIRVDARVVINARAVAGGLNLRDIIARGHGLARDMMSALLHSIVVAGARGAEIASCGDSSLREPAPGSANLATIAAIGDAAISVAASGRISDGEERSELATRSNADTIVERLSSAVGPA